MNNKDFVQYQEALDLKQLGFDEPCFGRYYYKESYPMLNPNSGETELVFEFGRYIKQTEVTILVPLYQQAFRWFREKYGLSGTVKETFVGDDRCGIICVKSEKGLKYLKSGESVTTKFFKEYEQAELECLKKLIEIVENGR
jgi:hypothetical protein